MSGAESASLVSFLINTLGYIVSPAVLEAAVKHGIQASGIQGVEAALSKLVSEQQKSSAAAKETGGKRQKKEKKEAKPRAPSPYTIFTSKVSGKW